MCSCLRANEKIEVSTRLVPLPHRDKAAREKVSASNGDCNDLSFCFWLCVVTERLLHSHCSLVSVSTILSLLEKRSESKFRVLPVLLTTDTGKTQAIQRFSQLLPGLWDRKPIISTLEEENARRVASIAYRVTKRGWNSRLLY